MESAPISAGESGAWRSDHIVLPVHLLAIAAAISVIALDAPDSQWNPAELAVIAIFTVVSGLTYVQTGAARVKVSGSFLGLMLAAILLGGAPAALLGILTIGVVWLRSHEAPHYLRNNLVTYMWFPLIGGLFFHTISSAAHLNRSEPAFYLSVFAAFLLALVLNFVGVVGYQCYLERSSLSRKTREVFAPVLAAELFSALLTMAAVYVAEDTGTMGLALFGLVLVVFQYLVGELLKSKRRAEQLHEIATTDGLTGLPNREHFHERVRERIAQAKQSGEPFAVLLMDLDRFKDVNDTLGHECGDLLLAEIGPRLVRAAGPAGVIARLGGDEFAILPSLHTDEPIALKRFGHQLLASVQQPFLTDDLSIEVGASLGIVRYPLDGADSGTLLRRADVAMYAAKRSQSGCELYERRHDRHSVEQLSMLGALRRALERDEIVVHFQPIVDVETAAVRGAEGLVRWQHPELGLLAPAAFVPLVEQTGLIRPLARRVLELSLQECARWRRDGRDFSVAVNLSVRNLLDPELPQLIGRLLTVSGLSGDALALEITESMLMSDPERVLMTVRRLSELGARVSIDDFGTGYSSLATLRQLPIDDLKIDRSFISPMLRDESDLIIVRSTINLGHDLGLQITAEGVEDAPTLAHLADLGCDLVQGFHLSRPLAPDAFIDWVRQFDGAMSRTAA